MSEEVTVTEMSPGELTGIMNKHIAWLDKREPNWRTDLADCCLGCSGPSCIRQLTRLDALYSVWWMLGGEGGIYGFHAAMTTWGTS